MWSVKMADSQMKRYPELWMTENAKTPRWGYTFGLIGKSMIELWKHTGDEKYYHYAKAYADTLIDDKGQIKTYSIKAYNLDNINAGKILFDLYEQTHDHRYKIAMDTLCEQLRRQPRTSEGGFWHKLIYPHQMWLDGIYMASPFIAQYGITFNEPELLTDAVNQIKLIARHTYDEETGLFYHGWDESKQQLWANEKTGTSPNFWSRSIGWYAAGVVDVLDFLPPDIEGRDSLLAIVNTLAKGIANYQDPQSKVWYQIMDQKDRQGNYLESSGSAFFVYFLFKSLNNNYIDQSYLQVALDGFNGIVENFIKEEEDGTYTITNCCAVAGLGGEKVYRDGSFEYYISEPMIENDPKSVGAFILTAIEYEKFEKTNK
jgi:unsaturated rhamnogalacturonyl hydrolase